VQHGAAGQSPGGCPTIDVPLISHQWVSPYTLRMFTQWRFLVLVLLVAAVPLKGLAAAGVLGCGHAQPLAAAALLENPDVQAAEHPCHGHQAEANQPPTTTPCGSCAPCCVAAAPYNPAVLVLAASRARAAPAAQPKPLANAPVDRPFEPPRASKL
jgi:hypothetical protein